jgi:hypothetical protein
MRRAFLSVRNACRRLAVASAQREVMMTEEERTRSQDEIMAILARLSAVTPALRAAGDTQAIVAALEQATRDLKAVIEAEAH